MPSSSLSTLFLCALSALAVISASRGHDIPTNVQVNGTTWYQSGCSGGGPFPGYTKMPDGSGWYERELRTGGPGDTCVMSPLVSENGTGAAITGLSFTYRYIVGYDDSSDNLTKGAPEFSVWLVSYTDATPDSGYKVYSTTDFSGTFGFSKCATNAVSCYSPPLEVSVTGLDIPNPVGNWFYVRFQVENNGYNLQFPVNEAEGFDLKILHGGGTVAGEVLLVLFFAGGAAYFLVGAAYMRFGPPKAQGSDVIPNKAFWTSLPGLVKEGSSYSFGRVRGTVSGQNNYEAI